MEALLLDEDIFSDPALMECADNPDGDSEPPSHRSTPEMVKNAASSATVSSGKIKSLNKKQKWKLKKN